VIHREMQLMTNINEGVAEFVIYRVIELVTYIYIRVVEFVVSI